MKKIPFADTGLLNDLITDYLAGKEKLRPFYHVEPTLEGILNTIDTRTFPAAYRKVLHDSLHRQYQRSGVEVPARLAELLNEDTFTVTTGHQLCLFGGPAYFFYKIASTIKLARQLEARSGRKVIPVFWMATEDHDVDEIDHVQTERGRLQADFPRPYPAGRLTLDAVQPLLIELPEIFGYSNVANEFVQIIKKAYKKGTLADATRRMVDTIFGEHDVVIVDGDDPDLKKLALPYFQRELESSEFAQAAKRTTSALGMAGYKGQAHVRDVNLFQLTETGRYRIEKENETLRNERGVPIEPTAESLSPNVILRPLYQEVILPNLAYVGGGGELSYWLQLKGIFDAAKVSMPVLVLRDSFLFIRQHALEQLEKDGFSLIDLFRDVLEVEKRRLTDMGEVETPYDEQRKGLETLFGEIHKEIVLKDPTLGSSVEAFKVDTLSRLVRLEKKRWRAIKRKERESMSRFNALRNELLPNGGLAERRYHALSNAADFPSLDGYVKELIEWADPIKGEVGVVSGR